MLGEMHRQLKNASISSNEFYGHQSHIFDLSRMVGKKAYVGKSWSGMQREWVIERFGLYGYF